ncbi:hypothetical protein BpHYR1_009933 [Brachionus plicatilis]|uniref:Uncharacterized protein n=1 Tax=Brachionus plicatilis TaxID=10195 RepID=A0A3M7RST4_BRAPC|nr:hypothetical protein BpHYR1_009933 [Brachionus plicatilis]
MNQENIKKFFLKNKNEISLIHINFEPYHLRNLKYHLCQMWCTYDKFEFPYLLSKAESNKMSLLVLYIKEIIELDNIHYSKNVLYQRNNSLSQDESIEQVKKTSGKGKVHLPFVVFVT